MQTLLSGSSVYQKTLEFCVLIESFPFKIVKTSYKCHIQNYIACNINVTYDFQYGSDFKKMLLFFSTILFPILQYTRSNKYNNDTSNSKDKQKQVKQFITHQHTHSHTDIYKHRYTHLTTYTYRQTDTHTCPPPHTHKECTIYHG